MNAFVKTFFFACILSSVAACGSAGDAEEPSETTGALETQSSRHDLNQYTLAFGMVELLGTAEPLRAAIEASGKKFEDVIYAGLTAKELGIADENNTIYGVWCKGGRDNSFCFLTTVVKNMSALDSEGKAFLTIEGKVAEAILAGVRPTKQTESITAGGVEPINCAQLTEGGAKVTRCTTWVHFSGLGYMVKLSGLDNVKEAEMLVDAFSPTAR